jgi:NAD(P)H-dependent FMN reductase
MQQNTIHLGIIYGSARQGRFCDTIVNWVLSHLIQDKHISLDRFDPKKLNLPHDMPPSDTEEIVHFKTRLSACDAFIVITPEYNHGYPAPLKAMIDSAKKEWERKPVAFVSYGGVSGGLRAVEQLRQVFAELHSVTMRDSVSFANPWELFDSSGNLKKPERFNDNFKHMLSHLKWWANSLLNAHKSQPLTS